MRVDHSTMLLCYATCADGQAVELRVQCQITMATKLFRPITDHGMLGEGDIAHNNIKHLKPSSEVFIGQLVRIRGGTHTITYAAKGAVY